MAIDSDPMYLQNKDLQYDSICINVGGIVNRHVQVESKEIEQDRRLLEHDQKIDSLFEAMDRRETDLSWNALLATNTRNWLKSGI